MIALFLVAALCASALAIEAQPQESDGSDARTDESVADVIDDAQCADLRAASKNDPCASVALKRYTAESPFSCHLTIDADCMREHERDSHLAACNKLLRRAGLAEQCKIVEFDEETDTCYKQCGAVAHDAAERANSAAALRVAGALVPMLALCFFL